jgi:hypothetical protein
MSSSLRDQLLKAGLVNAHRARQTERRKQGRQERGGRPAPGGPGPEQARAQKAERDRELNRQRQAEAQRKALAAEVADLVRAHRVSPEGGEVAYHFTDGKTVRRLYVTPAQQGQLAAGHLAIVRDGRGYALVPADAAEKIRARDEACVVVLNRPGPEGEADDPYAGYTGPDDLMW